MSAKLKQVSDAELEAELARRKKAKEAGERPRPVKNPDLTQLISTVESHIETLDKEGFTDDDSSHYIYEAAMKAIYGPKVFEWINKKNR